MSLLDQLKQSSAYAIDVIRHIAQRAGTDCEVTVVISHPGEVEDSFVVGMHELSELHAIVAHIERSDRQEGDVTSTEVGPVEIVKGSGSQ